MDILVPIKLVPDLVEELDIAADGMALDRRFMRLIPSEQDDHALEEALLLKERHGGSVTVITLDTGDADETLYTAIAKGADRAIKVTGDGFSDGLTNHAASSVLQAASRDLTFDLILTGAQATDDLDGSTGPLLAARLGLPFVGYVLAVAQDGGGVVVRKEYPGGLAAEMEVALPAVLGISAAEKPPRYVVTAKVMEAMKTATIEEVEAGAADASGAPELSRMYLPESGERAEMISGGVDQVADALVDLFAKRGLLA
jgi:electron transfer flavoprotein beta subunit